MTVAAGFVERIGALLIAPRAAMQALSRSTEGGLGDLVVLLGLRLLAGETRVGGAGADSSLMLARALSWLARGEPALLVQGLMQALSRLLPDVMAVVVGAVALALLAGRGGRGGGRELDLAAAAWIPALLVKLVAALAFTALGRDPGAGEERLVDYLALGWAAGVWAVALWTLRAERERLAPGAAS